MAELVVTQIRSAIGAKPKQRGTLRALGLGRIDGPPGQQQVHGDRMRQAAWQLHHAAVQGLATDTGWFQFSNADETAFRSAAGLIAAGAQPNTLYEQLYKNDPEARLRLIGEVLRSFELQADGRLAVIRVDRATLERVGATDRLLEPEQIQLLKQRCTATALILDDWRARHNRPVDAAALATFGQISEAFMERVVELLDEVGGQPDALLEALREGRVSRFRTDTSDALEQWLRESQSLSARREAAAMSAAELAHRSGLEPETAAKLREWIVSAIYDPLAQR